MSSKLKLKRDPAWLDLSLATGCGVVSLLSEDGHHQVSVPAAVLLAVSPLLRSMVSDLHPAAHGPLVLSVAISGDVLLLVGDILTKGVAVAFVKGDMMKGEVQGVFRMMGMDVFLDSCVLHEVVNGGRSDRYRSDKLKLEIVDQHTATDCILNKKKRWLICKKFELLSKDSITSNVVENMRISTAAEEFPQQGVNDSHVNIKSINNEAINDHMTLKVDKSTVRSSKSKEKTQKPAGEKRFKCDDCKYSAAGRKDLIKHKRTHSGERPFQCEHCDYSTARSDSLLFHTRKHTGEKLLYWEKPFKCDDCDYCAATSHAILLHRRIHTGEKPYKCDNCDYRADKKHHVKSHKKAKHTVVKPC